MTDNGDIPTEELDRIKFLVHRVCTTALYARYNWSSLSDRLYFTGLLCHYLDTLTNYVPSQLVQEIKSTVDPFEGFSVQPEVEVAQAYQDWASTYDQGGNPLIVVEEPHVRQLLGDLAGKWVADIACGTGRYSRYAIQQGAAVVHGVDFSEAMLRVAQGFAAHLDNMFVAQGKVEAIPLSSNCYDVAVCGLALQHAPDLSAAIHEITRLLKPGGILVISDFHPAMFMIGAETGIRNFMHSVEDYVTAMVEAGLHITAVREPKVGDLPAEFPRLNTNFVKLIAHVPFALIFKAQKQ
jgi:malonyl-CoA O-methyltransferase